MIVATTLAIGLCFILALAVIWRLMKAPQGSSHVPSVVAGLIGIALGIVLAQAAWLLATNQTPPPDIPDTTSKLVQLERQACDKDIATLTGRLEDLSKKQSATQTEISQAGVDIGNLATAQKPIGDAVSRIDVAVKRIDDTLQKHDIRLTDPEKYRETPPQPLKLNQLEVRPSTHGQPPKLALYPHTASGTIQFASIDFCPPPGSSGGCTPAPNKPQIKPNCTDSFICNGSHGTYVTFPPGVANTGPRCIRLTYTLQDQTPRIAWGGPIDTRDGAVWPSDPKTPNQCDQASPNQQAVKR
jgi:hypothetical protein